MTDQNQLLREALQQIADIQNEMYGGDWDEIEKARHIARAALAQPASPSQAQQPGVCTACVMPEQCAVDIAERGPCSGGVQQPSTQAWANETGLRQIECPSCGDLAVAYDPQQTSPATPADMAVYQSIADGYTKAQQPKFVRVVDGVPVITLAEHEHLMAQQPSGEVVAWRTFDGEGGYEYRDFEGNENYADEWAKRNPQYKEWVEPLTRATPKPEPVTWQPTLTAHFPLDQEPSA